MTEHLSNSYYGAHISISEGVENTIDYIHSIGGNMIQIFISNPMSTKTIINMKKFSPIVCARIKQKLLDTNSKLVIHLPYVINLAKHLGPNPANNWWIQIICNQLMIGESMGSIGCVVHVGKHLDLTISDGLDNMYESIKYIIEYMKTHNLTTYLILETAAGQGSELIRTSNNSIEDLADFYNKFDDTDKNYLKICVDTCHIFAAGYDIKTKTQVKNFFDSFNALIGIQHMALIHLNDSKTNCGSCVDRHQNIGAGYIGLTGLRHFIRYGLFYQIPIILETPSEYVLELMLINTIKQGINKWIDKNST